VFSWAEDYHCFSVVCIGENTYGLMSFAGLQWRLNKTGVHMKITLSRQEVEKILLDYANRLVENHGFDEVVGNSYRDLPSSVDIVKKDEEQK
jgi:hypothetical protein